MSVSITITLALAPGCSRFPYPYLANQLEAEGSDCCNYAALAIWTFHVQKFLAWALVAYKSRNLQPILPTQLSRYFTPPVSW